MLISSNLASTPFISFDDSTRLQMASKQLIQSLTSTNCEVPYILGNDWQHLVDNSRLFRYQAEYDGQIIYKNDQILIIVQNSSDPETQLLTLPIPQIQTTTGLNAVRLRYVKELGSFQAGDLLYEYDSFKNGLPVYGYNKHVLYMNFFGYTHEDAIVISESFAEEAKSTKMERVVIPIYASSLFKMLYSDIPNSYLYFPNIGQKIKHNVVAYKVSSSSRRNNIQSLKLLDPIALTQLINNDNSKYISIPEISRMYGGTVVDIKVHQINNLNFLDEKLGSTLKQMWYDYGDKVKNAYDNIDSLLSSEYARRVLSRYYVMRQRNMKDLAYIIELYIAKEQGSSIGDKFSSRHASKGVVSMILPDDLRPIIVRNEQPIDILQTFISVFSRMNLGLVIEGLMSKTIHKVEQDILLHNYTSLPKLTKLAKLFNNTEYSLQIDKLYNNIKSDNNIERQFYKSVRDHGLYFEADSFVQCEVTDMMTFVEEEFDILPVEPIMIPRETFVYMRDKLGILDVDVPKTNVIYNDLFTGCVYINKLMHEAAGKITIRDFGTYKKTTSQPTQGRGEGANASRIGGMEFEAMISAGMLNTINELRSVKSDARTAKSALVSQIISNGKYELPDAKGSSKTKLLIDSLIKFIHS